METKQITVPLYGNDAVLHCYQYDTNARIIVTDIQNEAVQIHFSLVGSKSSVIASGANKTVDGKKICEFVVPEEMLSQQKDIIGYVHASYNGSSFTTKKILITVQPRSKPEDWVQESFLGAFGIATKENIDMWILS